MLYVGHSHASPEWTMSLPSLYFLFFPFSVYLVSYLFGESDDTSVYGAPASSGYGAPSTGYASPSTGYASPATGYSSPSTTFNAAPAQSYGTPAQSYSAPSTSYSSPQVYSGYASRKGLDSSMTFVEKSISQISDWLHQDS